MPTPPIVWVDSADIPCADPHWPVATLRSHRKSEGSWRKLRLVRRTRLSDSAYSSGPQRRSSNTIISPLVLFSLNLGLHSPLYWNVLLSVMPELKSRHLFTITMTLPPPLELGNTPAGQRRIFTVS